LNITRFNILNVKCLEKGHYSSECPYKRRNLILKEQDIKNTETSSSSSNEEETPTFEEEI